VLYSEIIAVCSQIHTKHINTLCGQNVECRTYRAVNTPSLMARQAYLCNFLYSVSDRRHQPVELQVNTSVIIIVWIQCTSLGFTRQVLPNVVLQSKKPRIYQIFRLCLSCQSIVQSKSKAFDLGSQPQYLCRAVLFI